MMAQAFNRLLNCRAWGSKTVVLGETNTVTFTPYFKDIESGFLSTLSCAREKNIGIWGLPLLF